MGPSFSSKEPTASIVGGFIFKIKLVSTEVPIASKHSLQYVDSASLFGPSISLIINLKFDGGITIWNTFYF